MRLCRTAVALLGAASCAVGASTASAQTSSLDWLPKDWQAGAFVLTAPKYEGSSKYQVLGIPIIAPAGTGDGLVQVKGADDIRLRLFTAQGLEFGPLAGWRFSRDEEDAPRLNGLGDVDGGLVLGAYGAYRMGPVAAFVSYHHQVTGDDTGGLVRFGLDGKTRLQPWLTVNATLGSTWASDQYMRAFFSVTPDQSARSGLATYDASAGIKDVFLGLGADFELDQRWTLKLMGRYTHLVGDAADSPIVEREGQWFGGAGLTYRFSVR